MIRPAPGSAFCIAMIDSSFVKSANEAPLAAQDSFAALQVFSEVKAFTQLYDSFKRLSVGFPGQKLQIKHNLTYANYNLFRNFIQAATFWLQTVPKRNYK